MKYDITVVTPSYNMLEHLKKCSNSISDQGINYEHIVVDGHSNDGTKDWLKNQSHITSIIEHDDGMYHALNKGLMKANGVIVGHLNCDEQYLPGTLKYIKRIFQLNPNIDIVYGDFITVNNDGNINSFKKTIPFRKYYVLSGNLYIGTCALFYRKKIFKENNYFNTDFKSSGDKEFLLRLHDIGYRSLNINKVLSVFTVTGENLSQSKLYKHESKLIVEKYSVIPKNILKIFEIVKRIEKLFHGAYRINKDIDYSIYTNKSNKRVVFSIKKVNYITKYN